MALKGKNKEKLKTKTRVAQRKRSGQKSVKAILVVFGFLYIFFLDVLTGMGEGDRRTTDKVLVIGPPRGWTSY